MQQTALAGVRVLDLSRVLAGPWASQLLADLGAEVIKIERPGRGDDTRQWGPPWWEIPALGARQSAYFLCANRNKRSVTVDFTQAQGQEIVHRLARRCDVVIENFKVGGLAPYRLDYASLRAVNPRLVYCSITGFGQDGPYAMRGGYDFLIQGMSGLMSITGRPDEEPGGGPMKVGVALVDVLTGLYATAGILAALRHRDATGKGQYLELALLDVAVACLANQALNYLVSGQVPARLGNAHPNIVPYQDFPTADGHIIIAVGNDEQFARLCRVLGEPGWAKDARYATNAARVAHRDQLIPLIVAKTKQQPSHVWIELMQAQGVPCGPINDLAAVFADAQVQHRGLRSTVSHPLLGEVPQVANPLRLSSTPVQYHRAPPLLGEDTEAVLEELGYGKEVIAELRQEGVI